MDLKIKKGDTICRDGHISKEPTNEPKTDSKFSKRQKPKTVRFETDSNPETDPQKHNKQNRTL